MTCSPAWRSIRAGGPSSAATPAARSSADSRTSAAKTCSSSMLRSENWRARSTRSTKGNSRQVVLLGEGRGDEDGCQLVGEDAAPAGAVAQDLGRASQRAALDQDGGKLVGAAVIDPQGALPADVVLPQSADPLQVAFEGLLRVDLQPRVHELFVLRRAVRDADARLAD